MKRSRLALSSSFFGSSTLDVAQFSAIARQLRTDAVCLGPGFGAGEASWLASRLSRHHLRLEAAENVWIADSGPARHGRGETLSDPDSATRAEAIRLTVATALRIARMGGGLLIVRLGRVSVPDGETRFETVLPGLMGEGWEGPRVEEAVALAGDVRKAATAALDRVCRSLFEVLRQTQAEPLPVALVTGEPLVGIPGPEMLEQILEDLHSPRLGYWHDPVVALGHDSLARGLDRDAVSGEWLGRHSRRLLGVFLHDARGGEIGLPPGSGEVDWTMLREHLPSTARRVVRPGGGLGVDALRVGFDFLRGLGLD